VARGSIYTMGVLLALAVGLLVMAFVGFQVMEKSGLGHHVIAVKNIELVRKGDGYYIKLLITNEGSDPVRIERIEVTDGARTLVFGDGGAYDGLGGFLDTLTAEKVEIGPGQSFVLQAFHQVGDDFVLGQGVTATVHYTVLTTWRTYSLAVAGKAILSVDVIEREKVWVPTPPPLPTTTTTTTTTRTTTTTSQPPPPPPPPPPPQPRLYLVYDSATDRVYVRGTYDSTIIVDKADVTVRLSFSFYSCPTPQTSFTRYGTDVLVDGLKPLVRSLIASSCEEIRRYIDYLLQNRPDEPIPIYVYAVVAWHRPSDPIQLWDEVSGYILIPVGQLYS